MYVHLSVSHLLCWGGGIVLGGRSSLCPRALRHVWLDEVNKEAGLSVKVPMLETDGCATESETGLTDTAEPAAAGERQETSGIKPNPDLSVYVCSNVQHNFRQLLKRHLPSTDCGACIEVKPFCKANNEVELTGFYGNRPLIRSWRMVSSSEQRRLVYMPTILTTAETSDAFQDHH